MKTKENIKKVVIFIESKRKGFLIAVADQMSKSGFDVLIVARDQNVKNLVNNLLPNFSKVKILSEVIVEIDDISIEAERIEKKYNTIMAMLLSEDRSLGQGYLTNVEKIPNIIRAWWPFEKKIIELVKDIKRHEILLSGADLAIRIWPKKIITMILDEQKSQFFSFTSIKYGARMFWSNNEYMTSSRYIERILLGVDKNEENLEDYEIYKAGEVALSKIDISYKSALKKALNVFFMDTQTRIRGINKKNSYQYLGWVPSLFRSVLNYNYVKRNAVFLDKIKNYNLVYFPLHLEPEVSLQRFTPEFSNSMEAIIWISKSLPVNYRIVVREHPLSYGVRSRWYYNQLIKIPNVELAHPDIDSWEWIKKSKFVVAFTGTVGQEAVQHKKPILSYGKHQIINHLPTVHYVNNYDTTKSAISKIVSNEYNEDDFLKSKQNLSFAQIKSSIEMPEYVYIAKSSKLETDLAERALNHLYSEYPYLKDK